MSLDHLSNIAVTNMSKPWRLLDYLLLKLTKGPHLRKTNIPSTGQEISGWLQDDCFADQYFLQKELEPEMLTFLDAVLDEGMTVFDAGANIGYYSLIAASHVGQTGHVIAFEPIEEVFQLLKLNTMPYENTQIQQSAISDGTQQTININFYGIRFLNQSTINHPRVGGCESDLPNPEKRSISAVSIDQYVASTGLVPDIVKLDIEGAEMQALQGSLETITNHKPHFIIEVGNYGMPELYEDNRNCLVLLKEQGYLFFERDSRFGTLVSHDLKEEYTSKSNILAVHSDKLKSIKYSD